MGFKGISDLITSRREEYLEQLFTLLRQKSISAQNIGIEECALLVKELMKEAGIKNTSLMETDGYPVVYGEMIQDPEALTLLIYGHYDVQPPDPVEEWLTPPFEPTIRDGKIFCRGVGDNKGQLLAQVLAIKTYLDHYGSLPINIKFLFEGEEENGSKNLASFIEKNKDMLKADLVYTSDGPMHDSGAPYVLLGVRGMLYIEMTTKGANWDNHAGNKGNIVPNPAWRLVNLLNTMYDKHGHILIEGFYDHIRQPSEREKRIMKNLPFDLNQVAEGIGYKDLDMDGETYYNKLTMKPTFNIAGFTSGYSGKGMKTIIPSEATVKMDMRVVVDQDPKDIYEKVCSHVQKYAPDVEVKYLGDMIPSRTSTENKLVEVVTKAVHDSYNQEPVLQPSLGGSLPDYVWTKILGLPSVIVPYANFDEANHSPNENMNVENFFNGIHCTCHVINYLGNYTKKSSNTLIS
ncbi:M20/M25/M40 family metallo-hydrolase [Salicibibacter cibi]|uniref:M20/M25/M40 family metallo-hydrolase n=1 Tax=Salicibibacter cibi TaxID=2743001 RepID=A0A7T7CES2_9BACI|nr:M20/M25/M40 family metallo-hydrolase [Salicibibacter cibi]QQK79353.1 M20/M25/M40 family metallo-hydrolase [Salicibibacter cibi]